jgi:hypothetical protein
MYELMYVFTYVSMFIYTIDVAAQRSAVANRDEEVFKYFVYIFTVYFLVYRYKQTNANLYIYVDKYKHVYICCRGCITTYSCC